MFSQGNKVCSFMVKVTPRSMHWNFFCASLLSSMADEKFVRIHARDARHQPVLLLEPNQPLNPKRLRVGVIGMPNVGKSTLINSIMDKEILPTSKRIDTTRNNTLAVLSIGETQIEFQDSPGIHNKRKSKKITGSFQNAYLPGECMKESDMCMVVADLSARRTSQGFLQPEVLLHLLKFPEVPTILILNKIDKLSDKTNVLPLISLLTAGVVDGLPCKAVEDKRDSLKPISLPKVKSKVIETIDVVKTLDNANDISTANKTELRLLNQLRHCRGWSNFKDVFVISALEKQHTEKLKNYLIMKARSEPWKYHSSVITDASPYDIVIDALRSTMLENLAEEVPYCTKIDIVDWDEFDNVLEISLQLLCQKFSHLRFIQKASSLLEFGTKRRLLKIFNVKVVVNVIVHKL